MQINSNLKKNESVEEENLKKTDDGKWRSNVREHKL